jgi:two-component system sensor histidine kinase/response regulator
LTVTAAASLFPQLRGRRVLLVQDDEILCQVAGAILEAVGIVVETARDGAVGVQMARDGDSELVLLATQLPVMNGIEAAKKIREMFEAAELPIIAMSADSTEQDRQLGVDAGINDYQCVPIEPQALWHTLARWLPGDQSSLGQPEVANEYLDLARGLSHLVGNKPLYYTMLRRYAQTHQHLCAEVQSEITGGNLVLAERKIHDAVGLSGLIGATAMEAAASRLEGLLKRDAHGVEVELSLAQLDRALARTLGQIDTTLAFHAR